MIVSDMVKSVTTDRSIITCKVQLEVRIEESWSEFEAVSMVGGKAVTPPQSD